jgi:2-oxoglutarate ferredoxin oxidoreductase subunit alpha
MDDYMSLIRGGHNFSVVSVSRDVINSHYMKADLAVVFDQRSHDMHKEHVLDDGALVYDSDSVKAEIGTGIPMRSLAKKYPNPDLIMGVGALAILCASIGFDREKTQDFMRNEFRRDTENNVAFAGEIHDESFPLLGNRFSIPEGDMKRPILTGNEAIALGAAAAGLDIYFAYPMTPSTSLLHFLAARGKELGVVAVHPENEIAVANMAIGAASMGAKAMVGSSGGGFALMEEAFSLAGMTETPLLCLLSSRPGPSTGVPTYTEQGDLRFALHQGHGEFPRIVASPGTVEEAFRLTSEMLDLVWRFQTPGILLTEKHLSESSMTVELEVDKASWPEPLMHNGGEYKRYLDSENGISPLLFPPSNEVIKWNSYEHDERGVTSEEPEWLTRMHDKRLRKAETLRKHMESMHTIPRAFPGQEI